MNRNIIFVFFLFLGTGFHHRSNTETWIVKASSSLTVHGSTNINTFTCSVPAYGKSDTLTYLINQKHGKGFRVHSILHVPVARFDCENKFMTKDLQKTLKVEKHPYVIIDFKYLSDLPNTSKKTIEGHVDISIAGVKKHFIVPFTPSKKQNVFLLKGKKQVLFSDFNLIPPSKLGGTIKVNNQLDVEVNLTLDKHPG